MTKPYALITGGGTGIGLALTIELVKAGYQVLICGRRESVLLAAQQLAPDNIDICVCDIATSLGRATLVSAIPKDAELKILVHHANTLQPIGLIEEITVEGFRAAMASNVEAPLFLLQALLPQLHGCRVLQLSSGQAHNAQLRMTAYGATKAALFNMYKNLNTELNERNIYIGSVQPGIVQTESMYNVWLKKLGKDNIHRLADEISALYGQKLFQPEEVGNYLCKLLLETTDQQFSEKEWDIRKHNL